MNTLICQVHSLTPLTPFVYKVLLKPERTIDFIAGQYLQIVMAEKDKRPFSIANAPGSELIELQIGAASQDSWANQVIERLKNEKEITIEVPLGNAGLRTESTRPILLVAGGTGFSYIKSIFEFLSTKDTTQPVIVYWGLRDFSATYELEKTAQTIAKIPHSSFIPVIQTPEADWQGKTGLVHQAVMQDIVSFEPYDIYLAGRFDMVGIIREDFVKKGALLEHMYADAFAFI